MWVDGCVDDGHYNLWCPTGTIDPTDRVYTLVDSYIGDWDYCDAGCARHDRDKYGCGEEEIDVE